MAVPLTPSAKKYVLLALGLAVAIFAIGGWLLWRLERSEQRRRHAELARQAREQQMRQEVEEGERELREKLDAARHALEPREP